MTVMCKDMGSITIAMVTILLVGGGCAHTGANTMIVSATVVSSSEVDLPESTDWLHDEPVYALDTGHTRLWVVLSEDDRPKDLDGARILSDDLQVRVELQEGTRILPDVLVVSQDAKELIFFRGQIGRVPTVLLAGVRGGRPIPCVDYLSGEEWQTRQSYSIEVMGRTITIVGSRNSADGLSPPIRKLISDLGLNLCFRK